jgi:4-hydroxy-tetrahydrodipicolinate synthase
MAPHAGLAYRCRGGKAAGWFWRCGVEIPGIIVAPLTPFNRDLRVDLEALRRQIDYAVDACGAAAVTAAGVETQEYQYLTFPERLELVTKTAEFVNGRCPVIAGISHPSFRTSIELAHAAEELGADAVQLLAPRRPFGGPAGRNELLAYFEAVSRETTLPIVLYLNPGPGAEVAPEWTIEIAKLEKVRFIKESSRDLSRVARLIVEIDHEGLAHYFTNMQMLLTTLELGGPGAEMPPPACKIASRVLTAFRAGDHERAAELQLQFALFPARWMHRGLAPVMKAALEIVGVPVGQPYPPFEPLDATEEAALAAYLETTCLFD